MMREFFVVMTIGVLGFFAYQTHTEPQTRHNSLMHRLTYPTDVRVRYRIGQVDERFGLGRDEVKRLAHEAVMIWHDGTGSEWFVYDEDAKLTINLIYDERQIETNERQKIRKNLDKLQKRHQADIIQLESDRKQLHEQFDFLQKELADWQAKYNRVQEKLQYTQDPTTSQMLILQRNELIEKRYNLNEQKRLYEITQENFNRRVDKINTNAHALNQEIEQTKARLTPREFHKGEFQHGSDTIINIYEFENVNELRLVLAHELGHALYLDHNDDPTALMYPYAQEQDLKNFRLKQADIDLLNTRQFYK